MWKPAGKPYRKLKDKIKVGLREIYLITASHSGYYEEYNIGDGNAM
jgi:guanyl-specific ribonuclease Sa